jgi:hypothetical protein
MARSLLPLLVLLVAACGAGPGTRATPAEWTPAAWADESTVTLRTAKPGGDPHWFPVWLAVLDDDQLYVRLGRKASARFEENGPIVGVRIAGKEFDRIRWESVPDLVPRIDAAIDEKYWSNSLIEWAATHPLTVRLRPE